MRSVFFYLTMIAAIGASANAYDWNINPGDGTPNNPYQISEPNHLMAIGSNTDLLDKHFILMNDIVFAPDNNPSHRFVNSLIASNESILGFLGVFDGQHYTIENLTIGENTNEGIGLFGIVGSSGLVKNLKIDNANIHGERFVGLLAGINLGSIYSCLATGVITCDTVLPENLCGGLVGSNEGGSITCCYTINQINLGGSYRQGWIGGFAGRNCSNGIIDRCGSWSAIKCDVLCQPHTLGGFVGGQSLGGVISNCYAQGLIHTNNENMDNIGGFAGSDYGDKIEKCYCTVRQIHEQIDSSRGYNIGGFVGSADHGHPDSFSDIGKTNVSGTSTTEQMQSAQTYLTTGWDFVDEVANGSQDIWLIQQRDYPRLNWLPDATVPAVESQQLTDAISLLHAAGTTAGRIRYHYSDTIAYGTVTSQLVSPNQIVQYGKEVDLWISNGQTSPYSGGGEGTPENPCRIGTYADLVLLGQTPEDYDKCFLLINDIDMAPSIAGQSAFSKAVVAPASLSTFLYQGNGFQGIFDGNNHTLSHLAIMTSESSTCRGLFGMASQSHILNLNLTDFTHTCTSDQITVGYTGALVGRCIASEMENCSVQGNVSTYYKGNAIGGLVGELYYSRLKRCRSAVDLDGRLYLGGLVGRAHGAVVECSTSGQVNSELTSGEFCGGLVGNNHADISRSFSTGPVSGRKMLGGLIGQNSAGKISNCYSQSTVTGEPGEWNGCLIGVQGVLFPFFKENASPITHCLATGHINSESVNGILGFSAGTANIINSFWDIDLVGISSEIYGTGLTTEQMKQQANFIGWDFVGESANGDNEIWRMCVDDVAYPRLSWEFARDGDFACGDGMDFCDLEALAECWLLSEVMTPITFSYACDGNGDGVIDLADFGVLSDNWP